MDEIASFNLPCVMVETIEWDGRPLAFVLRAGDEPDATAWITPPELELQLGQVVGRAGDEVTRHAHRPVERRLTRTAEVVVVQQGRCLLDLYAPDHELVATRELVAGDAVLLVAGGHGFRMLDDTRLLDVKQGPYAGADDKDFF